MTEMLATDGRPKRRNDATRDPVLVSSYALAPHLGMTRQYIARLAAEGVIARRGDGYDLDQAGSLLDAPAIGASALAARGG